MRGSGGLFLKSPETFWANFWTIPSLASQRRGSKPSNFAILLVFVILKTCKKISFSKQADCSLTTSFLDPKSSRDFRETGPWRDNSSKTIFFVLCPPQAAWRGYLVRADLEMDALAALRIQSCWRMYLARRDYLVVRDRIILLQSHIKGYLERKRFVWR